MYCVGQYGSSKYSKVFVFSDDWNYIGYLNYPKTYTNFMKYVNGFIWCTAKYYFYKATTNFVLVKYFYKGGSFQEFAFDPKSSLFYVTSQNYKNIYIFTTACTLVKTISTGSTSYIPFSITYDDGTFYIGEGYSTSRIQKLQNDTMSSPITISNTYCKSTYITGKKF